MTLKQVESLLCSALLREINNQFDENCFYTKDVDKCSSQLNLIGPERVLNEHFYSL